MWEWQPPILPNSYRGKQTWLLWTVAALFTSNCSRSNRKAAPENFCAARTSQPNHSWLMKTSCVCFNRLVLVIKAHLFFPRGFVSRGRLQASGINSFLQGGRRAGCACPGLRLPGLECGSAAQQCVTLGHIPKPHPLYEAATIIIPVLQVRGWLTGKLCALQVII